MRPGGKAAFCRQLSTKLMKCGSVTAASDRFTENAGGSFFQTLGILVQPADELADHAAIDHRRQAMIGGGLHHALGRSFLAVDHVPQQHFETANAFGLSQAHELLHAQHHFLIANLRVHRLERQRHGRLRLLWLGTRHRVQGLRDLGGDVRKNRGHRGREESSRRIFVFERRVFDYQQADALQRGVQVAQREHHRGARAFAAQEARLARRAEHERVQRIVQRLAKFDAEIGGGAVQDFAARVIQRDRAITRVRQRLLERGDPVAAQLQ